MTSTCNQACKFLDYGIRFFSKLISVLIVVLLDLKLPKIDGLEVLKQVKGDEKLKCLPVVILTSSKEDQDIVEGYRLGANSYIVKPVNFHDFIDVIKLIGSYWAIVSEPPPVEQCTVIK